MLSLVSVTNIYEITYGSSGVVVDDIAFVDVHGDFVQPLYAVLSPILHRSPLFCASQRGTLLLDMIPSPHIESHSDHRVHPPQLQSAEKE